MNRLAIASSLLALTIVGSPLASAQNAPVTRGVTSGDLASTVQDMRQQNARLNLEVSRLEDEVAQMNGKVETLEFLLSQSRDEMNRLQEDDSRIGSELERLGGQNSDLKQRLANLESRLDSLMSSGLPGEAGLQAGAAGDNRGEGETEADYADERGNSAPRRLVSRSDGAGEAGEPGPGSNPTMQGSLGSIRASDLPGEAGPLFTTARSRLLRFDYVGAEEAFRAFLDQFGDDPQAVEAQYWLAETLFQQEAYAESGQAYTQMIREYPENARAPDALAKLARAMRLVGDTEKACNALDILSQQYPDVSDFTRTMASRERKQAGCDT